MNLLVTGSAPYTPQQLQAFEALGFRVWFLQREEQPLPLPVAEVDAVVGNGLFLHHPIEDFHRLRFIQLTSVGFDRVDMDYVEARGIEIHNARGVYSIPMAEWVLMRVLEHLKHARHFAQAQSRSKWEKDRGIMECVAKRVAILGAGNIGQTVARYLHFMGMEITGYDIRPFEHPDFKAIKPIGEFAAEVGGFDAVVITLPLLQSTFHLFDRELLQRLKDGSLLVNIARGAIIDTEALVEVLTKRRELYAALDVVEQEPLAADSPLWQMPNVTLSPHNSFISDGNQQRLFAVVYDNLKSFLQ